MKLASLLFLTLTAVLLLGACDLGSACGLDAVPCGPPPAPTCGTIIPTSDTWVWDCNLPPSAAWPIPITDPDPANPPCGVLLCTTSSADAEQAAQLARNHLATLGLSALSNVQCKKWGPTYGTMPSPPVGWAPDQCAQQDEAPCGMFGDPCSLSGPMCCKEPESPRNLICGDGSDELGGICCIRAEDPCQPGWANGGCCSENGDGASVCGDGVDNSDGAHEGICCEVTGVICTVADLGAECCSGSCYDNGGGDYGECDSL